MRQIVSAKTLNLLAFEKQKFEYITQLYFKYKFSTMESSLPSSLNTQKKSIRQLNNKLKVCRVLFQVSFDIIFILYLVNR